MNIVSEIKKRDHGKRIAIIEGDLKISFDDLFSAVTEIADQLTKHPAFAKDQPRIGVQFPNGLGYIITALAVLQTGACFVPIPDELTPAEQKQLIATTSLHAIITPSQTPETPLPHNLGNAKITTPEFTPPTFPEIKFNALHPAFIRFSSGTTGYSKGVVISHQSLLQRITAANRALELTPADNVLWTLPMAHHFAVSIILYLHAGATTVLSNSHQPDDIYLTAKASKTTFLYGSPFHFAQLGQCRIAEPLPHLRLAIATASALNIEVAQAFQARFNLPLTQALGIIEIGLPIINLKQNKTNPTALGQPLPDYKIQIQKPTPTDPIGNLLIQGPGMFDAYLSPWQTRQEITDPDGYFNTGDLAEQLTDSTIIMHGRSKSVINVAGMKVFPEEIEATLNSHPAIKKSKVTPTNHPTLGAYPTAEYIPTDPTKLPTNKDLKNHCAQNLAPYKIPLTFKPVQKIDLTPSGKVKRH